MDIYLKIILKTYWNQEFSVLKIPTWKKIGIFHAWEGFDTESTLFKHEILIFSQYVSKFLISHICIDLT